MTVERVRLVRLPVDDLGLRPVLAEIRLAMRRANKSIPGERTDIIRYEALSSQLERAAGHQAELDGAEVVELAPIDREGHCYYDDENMTDLPLEARIAAEWIAAGDAGVELREPLTAVTAGMAGVGRRPAHYEVRSPAVVFRATEKDGSSAEGRRAIALRFRQQLQVALSTSADGRLGALTPSGVSNSVLTEGLREFVGRFGERRDVPVTYRDGSTGAPFPLQCLKLRTQLATGYPTYRFAMLSIRHTEMDVEIDGAWFRNASISRPRPAGETDQLAYEITQRQLAKICARGPVLLYLYQTGLDPAVVGFYRAVTEHLLRKPRTLAVAPMYFRRTPGSLPTARQVAGYDQQSTFRPGKPWAV
jgi:hypothetical protein